MNPRAGAITAGIACGTLTLTIAGANLVWPSSASTLVALVAHLVPGYAAARTPEGVMVLTMFATIDGAIAGYALTSLYNHRTWRHPTPPPTAPPSPATAVEGEGG